MNLEMTARSIQLIIAPAVMITSCCIFTNSLLGHYTAIGERLPITIRERVDLLQETETDKWDAPALRKRWQLSLHFCARMKQPILPDKPFMWMVAWSCILILERRGHQSKQQEAHKSCAPN
jgi:hypothetical protein